MKKLLLASALISTLTACSQPAPSTVAAKRRVYERQERVVHTSDGRYAYDDGGIWFWYVMTEPSRSASTTTYYTSPVRSSPSGSTASYLSANGSALSYASGPNASGPVASSTLAMNTLPTGGAWARGSAPTEEEMEGAVEEPMELEVLAEGEPAIEEVEGESTQASAQQAAEEEAPAEAPAEGEGASGSASGSTGGGESGSASGGSSGSSDSGSGGGGGDGGGGGGGGDGD